MILVNGPGDAGTVYSHLSHVVWNGWTFADTVFPSFLFIVGVSLVFSITKQVEKGIRNSAIIVRLLRRTIILFTLGLFMNIFPTFQLSAIRIPGVLQRIALCYFFASLIVLEAGLRGRILWLVGLLASYWLMMRFIPVPGIGASGVFRAGINSRREIAENVRSSYWRSQNHPLLTLNKSKRLDNPTFSGSLDRSIPGSEVTEKLYVQKCLIFNVARGFNQQSFRRKNEGQINFTYSVSGSCFTRTRRTNVGRGAMLRGR